MLDERRGELLTLDQGPISPPKLLRLPTEVCERILDKCDVLTWESPQDRARTFAACCSTCRDWLPRSRYHLFKQVIVQSKEQVKQISKLLHSIPAFRTRVETLIVYGRSDGKRDASWIGLVGFHLGPKLKALNRIYVQDVDFSLMKLEAYTFWGAFNRAWRLDILPKIYFRKCTVTHLNQLVRLASVTKVEALTFLTPPNERAKSVPPAPVLLSGISLPLYTLTVDLHTSDLVLPTLWHTLAKQCPSLSAVDIRCQDEDLDLSSPDGQLFLASVLCMFHRMQRRKNASYVRLQIPSLPVIEMMTRPCDKSTNADDTPLATQPPLHRELVLEDSLWNLQPCMKPFVKVLTLLQDAMMLINHTNRRFHYVTLFGDLGPNDLRPDSFQSLDAVLSRLYLVTHDVRVVFPRNRYTPQWSKERFPMLTSIVPNAFDDPESRRSHSKQADGVEQGQEAEESESEESDLPAEIRSAPSAPNRHQFCPLFIPFCTCFRNLPKAALFARTTASQPFL